MSNHDYNVPMSRRESFQRGYDEGFRAGAEAMREAAAKHINGMVDHSLYAALAEAIRALPLPEAK